MSLELILYRRLYFFAHVNVFLTIWLKDEDVDQFVNRVVTVVDEYNLDGVDLTTVR